ncbi:MAG: TonB family protein [Terracidiphilus sp.]
MPFFLGLYLAVVLPGFAQTAANAGPGLPKEPREVFAAAAPFYDFASRELKPWHLKATYQLYDEKGKHSTLGTYEYWWVSPLEHRSTWTRTGMTHTDWYPGDGKYAYESSGEPMNLFEFNLQSALLSPLPKPADLDPSKFHLEDEGVATNGAMGPCFTILPITRQHDSTGRPDQGPFPTYCFESQRPALRNIYSFERVLTQFSDILEARGKYLAREVRIVEGKHLLLTAKVDAIDEISSTDPALAPPGTASRTDIGFPRYSPLRQVEIKKEVAANLLIKKLTPIYPLEAKREGIQGNVVLFATIGTDGRIHDLRVISAPSSSLAASSFSSVSQWEYKPYLLNGEPVPIQSTIVVTFALGK